MPVHPGTTTCEQNRPALAILDGLAVLLLAGLTAFDSVADVLAATPEIEPILPDLYHVDGDLRVDFPGQQAYYEGSSHPWTGR